MTSKPKKDDFEENNRGQSKCWKYFLLNQKTEEAKCKECDAIISVKGKSTSSMMKHLKLKHQITFDTKPITEPPSSSKTLKDFYKTKPKEVESQDEVVAKLAAVDGLTFGQIANSEMAHKAFKAYGVPLPKSKTTVRKLLMQNFEKVKEGTVKKIEMFLEDGQKFSLTLDEYTSTANKGYMNVNLHLRDASVCNLGVIWLDGPLPAERIVELLQEK